MSCQFTQSIDVSRCSSTPPPTGLSVILPPFFSFICCVVQLGHPWPNLSWIRLDATCVLLLLFLCAWVGVCTWSLCILTQKHISVTVRQSSTSSTALQFQASHKTRGLWREKNGSTQTHFLLSPFLCLLFFPHTVPVEPCPGQRGAVPTMSPASWHRGRGQGPGLPPPMLCSPPPARPTGQLRGWCGCHQRSTASR